MFGVIVVIIGKAALQFRDGLLSLAHVNFSVNFCLRVVMQFETANASAFIQIGSVLCC
jgi:hypothetical protein